MQNKFRNISDVINTDIIKDYDAVENPSNPDIETHSHVVDLLQDETVVLSSVVWNEINPSTRLVDLLNEDPVQEDTFSLNFVEGDVPSVVVPSEISVLTRASIDVFSQKRLELEGYQCSRNTYISNVNYRYLDDIEAHYLEVTYNLGDDNNTEVKVIFDGTDLVEPE